MKIGLLFENILSELDILYNEGKKLHSKLKIIEVNGKPRFFLNYPKNKGSFSIGGFKHYLANEKIKKTVSWLYKKKLIKNINWSVTTNSVYFTLNGKEIRLSDHRKGSFNGVDVLIQWNTQPNEIKNIFDSIQISQE